MASAEGHVQRPDESGAAEQRTTGSRSVTIRGNNFAPVTTGDHSPVSVNMTRFPDARERLALTAQELAISMAGQWHAEEQRWLVHDPFPLSIRYAGAEPGVFDHWENVNSSTAEVNGRWVPELDGRFGCIEEDWRRIPSGRLVILGSAGSGKTALVIRFTLSCLDHGSAGDPVPAVLNLGSWDPDRLSLRGWVCERLIMDHPGLKVKWSYGGQSLAAALYDAGLILPVLDGFDELAVGLRPKALKALNQTSIPLLLTSRPAEYEAAAAETDVLTAAAGVRIEPLGVDDLITYLPRSARPRPGMNGEVTTTWDAVLARFHESSAEHAERQLAAALDTPLMVALARAVYSDDDKRDPAELLDTGRFPTVHAVQAHLVAAFVPAVYERGPTDLGRRGRGGRRTDPKRAEQWLRYLATVLSRRRDGDLGWWQLAGPTIGFALFAVPAVLALILLCPPNIMMRGLGAGFWNAFTEASIFGAINMCMSVKPSHRHLRLHGRWHLVLSSIGFGATSGAAFGIVTLHFAAHAPVLQWRLLISLGGGIVFGATTAFASPVDITSVASPLGLLSTTRSAALLLTSGMVVELAAAYVLLPASALPVGIASCVVFGLLALVGGNAWGRWLLMARLWLPLVGKLPWPLVDFLEEACRLGVLRQMGAYYQFRHPMLLKHLAAPPSRP